MAQKKLLAISACNVIIVLTHALLLLDLMFDNSTRAAEMHVSAALLGLSGPDRKQALTHIKSLLECREW